MSPEEFEKYVKICKEHKVYHLSIKNELTVEFAPDTHESSKFRFVPAASTNISRDRVVVPESAEALTYGLPGVTEDELFYSAGGEK